MQILADDNITFEKAIKLTQIFLNNYQNLNENDQEIIISSLVKSENGARGFFVTYLTDNREIADIPSEGVIKGLKSSPEIVSELLVKNVAMSTAMKISHQRSENEEMAQNSERVTNRSIQLIKDLKLDIVTEKIKQLITTITEKKGIYQDFLNRWNYDDQQQEMIKQNLQSLV